MQTRSARRRAGATATGAVAALAALVATGVVAPAATAAPTVASAPAAVAGAFLAPYYTALDLTGDQQVTTADLEVLATHLGETSASPGWPAVAAADVNGDDVITVADLSGLAQRMIYDDGPFELVEASALEMQAAMNAGVTTSVKITQGYLDRIAALDRTLVDTGAGGRALNSIIATNAQALTIAAQADATRAQKGMTSPLLGIPIAVKDNYDTVDMPTTGGCGCWDGNQTSDDATMVKGLRAAGAVILAKASLDEFAYGFVSEFSSGQDAGKTLFVASPLNTAKTAGGSSGGTGAAIAANFAGIGFGTDTGGSIRVPSTYNSLVGIRPTVGLASREGIIPLALSQDTGGPIARSVTDAAIALDAVTGVDAADPITAEQTGRVPNSYTAALDPSALKGKRIGIVTSMLGSNATVTRLWADAKATFAAQGATVVEITAVPSAFTATLNEGSGSTNEFKHDLNVYIQNHLDPSVTNRSIADIVASGRNVTSRNATYNSRNSVTESQYQAWAGPSGTHTAAIALGNATVTQLLNDNTLDALVYPSGSPYNTISTNMRLSPNTGLPAITVPMGQATAADATVTGANVNLEFLGRDYDESGIIGLAYSFEQATHARATAALYGPLK
ncbi:hypothetical protein KNO15_13155 [Leifsonia shinshuensis]|uniref:amidase family protein n=1 Tax=Leifsonia shinshuensis TaxID=150026 RepID=UPI001F509683|nr:amidase family protein [Leifsonia shinshuensis]MCI0157643.1 hypothetical protein [Leifsonia shinshuensis]